MSRLAQYRELEKTIARQSSQLEALKAHPGLKQELEFENRLQGLLAEYGKSLQDVVSILEPRASGQALRPAAEKRTRRARRVKVYRNPLTGETVETKGGNNKLLGAWKAQFGHDEVESWVKDS